jgi:hypothetical protein
MGKMLKGTSFALAAVVALLAAAAAGAPVPLGPGKMSVTPATVTAGSTNDLTFTFVSDRGSLKGQTTIDFATGWTPPQRGNPAAPGYLELQHGTCSTATKIVSLKARRLTIATSCRRNQSYVLLYHAATAPTIAADGYLFLARTKRSGVKKAKFLALGRTKQPIVKVTGAAAVGLGMVVTSVATAGTPFSVTVRGVDQYGNNASNYFKTVTLSSSDHAATLPGPYTYKQGDGAQHEFDGVVLRTPGAQTITATDSDGKKVTSAPITVSPFGG